MARIAQLFCLLTSLLVPAACAATEIIGAGSTAARPLYEKWARYYQQSTNIALRYEAIGSSSGVRKIRAREVHFGASDVALSREQMAQDNLLCFPVAISGVVPVINLPGIKTGELALTGSVLADIFAGKIRRWDDAAIAAINPDLRLPKLPITPVVRQDGSGTTYNFTDYLSKASPAWKASLGTGFTLDWPSAAVREKGSSGISARIRATAGAIGYIDYNYVIQDKLSHVKLQNRDGRFVQPSPLAFSAALGASSWKTEAAFEEMLTDKPGLISWPITMGIFVIVPRMTNDAAATIAALKFFTWAFMNGDGIVDGIDFVRLPDAVQARIYRELTKITDQQGRPLQWSLL